MPPKYKSRRKRVFKKRSYNTPWYNTKYSLSEIAQKAYTGVKYLSGLVNAEKFKFDSSIAWTPTTAGDISSLNLIAQGDGDSGRTGNSIFVRGLSIQGNMSRNSAGTYPDGQVVKLMVVMDTQQVGDTSPAITDIIESNGVNSFLNSDTVGRFQVLYNKRITLDTQHPNVLIKFNKSMRHHIRFNGSGASDVQKGGLYVLALSNESTNAPTVGLQCRLTYHDN